MTDKHKSERDLFEDDPADSILEKPRREKRQSFGPKLPIMPSSYEGGSSSNDENTPAATGTGGPSTASAGYAASTLGSTIGSGARLDGLTLRVEQNGQEVELNIWTSILRGTRAKEMFKFVNAVSKTNVFDAKAFIEGISYQGFNREFYILSSLKTISISMFIRFAILGAIRGSNFTKIQDTCLDMPTDMIALHNSGLIVKKAKKRTDMTILRFTASVPQWCCYWMHAAQVEKKIPGEDCPGWLQFPGAASLPMSEDLRRQHLRFSIAFSKLLPGGKFNENIYYTAYTNMIPLSEVPEALRLVLGVSNMRDAKILTTEDLARVVESSRSR